MPSSCFSRCLLQKIPFVGKIQVQCNVFCFISFYIVCLKSAILCFHSFRLHACDPQRISTMLLPAGDFLEIARWDREFSPGIPMGISDFHGQLVQKPEYR